MELWTQSLHDVHIQVIDGNHDRGVSTGWRGSIEWIVNDYLEPPFRFVHDDWSARSVRSPGVTRSILRRESSYLPLARITWFHSPCAKCAPNKSYPKRELRLLPNLEQ